jgi:hypothetical protein
MQNCDRYSVKAHWNALNRQWSERHHRSALLKAQRRFDDFWERRSERPVAA